MWPTLRDYFADGWNLFDFTVIAVSLLPVTGGLATLARLFRVLRFVSARLELQLILSTLTRSVPGMLDVIALMAIVFCVYGVAGYHLFREFDPTHWRTLGISLLSLFRIATLDWAEIMYAALEHEMHRSSSRRAERVAPEAIPRRARGVAPGPSASA